MLMPLSPKPPILVFDLDGTLADSNVDLIGTLNVILAREGVRPIRLDQAKDVVGAGARAMLQRAFRLQGRDPDAGHMDRLYADFLDHYGEHLADHTPLFPGVVAALDDLAADGWSLAVCTNKIERHSVKLLDALGIAGHFRAICGRDSFPFFKPDPRHLTLTIEKAGGDPARAVMIGDSRTDIDTAKAAGIPVVAVTFGYTDVPVSELGPDVVIEHFDALRGAVQALAGTTHPRHSPADGVPLPI